MRPRRRAKRFRAMSLLDALMPQRGEDKGLLALMLMHDAAPAPLARTEGGGHRDWSLEEQDRAMWDHARSPKV